MSPVELFSLHSDHNAGEVDWWYVKCCIIMLAVVSENRTQPRASNAENNGDGNHGVVLSLSYRFMFHVCLIGTSLHSVWILLLHLAEGKATGRHSMKMFYFSLR